MGDCGKMETKINISLHFKKHYANFRIKWGANYPNHIVRSMFYSNTFGKETESAKPLLNLLDVLTVDNIYHREILKFHIGIMAFSLEYLTIHLNMLEIHVCMDKTQDIQPNRIL